MSKCPTCQTEFALISYEGQELLQCPRCRGFWFPNGQFKAIKQIGFSGLCSNDNSDQMPRKSAQNSPDLACPDCMRETLVAYNYAYSSEIQLHRCTACKGIWAEQRALADIEALLVNYQESLEEAKAKALPLMMEVKRQFQEQEEAREAERQKQKKPGLIGRLFQKKPPQQREPVDIFADMQANAELPPDADSHIGADGRPGASIHTDTNQEEH